jgi:putative NADH-flavin reductase
MKIVVFGATGGTGKEILTQAVAQGHTVTAFARDPEAVPKDPNIRVFQGDIFDPEAVAEAIAGHRAVLSALGARTLKKAPVLSRAMPAILNGMHRHYVSRLIVLGAAGASPGHGKYQSALSNIGFWLVKHTMLKNPFADQAAQERLLAQSDIDYTIVRPPRLTEGPFTGTYRVLPDARPSGGLRISRADVAHFMLLQLTDPRFHRLGPYIAT